MINGVNRTTGCAFLKERWGDSLSGEQIKYTEQCSFTYGLRIIQFNNPDDLKDTNRIELCDTHFHEVFDKYTRPEAIAESRYNSEFKRINLIKTGFKEAHDWEMLRQYNGNPNQYKKLNDAKLQWDYLKLKKCHNDQCPNELINELTGFSRKVFSIIIFNQRGGMLKKINLCSYQCWNKIRLYIGIVRPKEMRIKPQTLTSYF